MIQHHSLDAFREQLAAWRAEGARIALVPTMGNLHEGHLELVRKARERADRVVVTLFVNPLQFGEGEDFDGYPRTMAADVEKLEKGGVDLLFAPTVPEVYPRPRETQTRVTVPGLGDTLCGASRPGHFTGVATVVCKFFNMAQPDIALFGEKDFQQLLVIRRMVEDLCIPLEIEGVPTVREEDGLALSSRNRYLSEEERGRAPALFSQLRETAAEIEAGNEELEALEKSALKKLEAAGFEPDYFTVRRAGDLALPAADDGELVILAAARLGKARLIDNLRLNR